MTGSSKPTTTTDITYNKDKIPYNPKDVISKAEQFTWVDWKTYQTVRNSDNTLTTIDVTTWQPVTSKYTDTERDSIKQGLLWWTPQDLELKKQQEELLKQQQDPDVMFNTLVAGWIIDKSSPNYTAVNKRFQDYNTYKNYSENQMKTALKDWTIMSWTTAYNDLIKDPVTKLKIDKANILNMVNNENLDINKALDNKSTEILNTSVTVNWQETTIWKAMEDWYITQEEYNSMTSNSKITAKEQEAEDLKNSADELQNIYDWIKAFEDLQASIEWKTWSYARWVLLWWWWYAAWWVIWWIVTFVITHPKVASKILEWYWLSKQYINQLFAKIKGKGIISTQEQNIIENAVKSTKSDDLLNNIQKDDWIPNIPNSNNANTRLLQKKWTTQKPKVITPKTETKIPTLLKKKTEAPKVESKPNKSNK